jgi:probable F420-dependent oxidoreductase
MQIGIFLPTTEIDPSPQTLKAFTQAVENMGYDYITTADHVLGAPHAGRTPPLWGPYTEKDNFHEAFLVFAFLSGISERLEFATSVLVLPQRQTALVAKQSADLAVLSENRFRLGVGVGWNYLEFDALAQDFTTRGARIEQQIALLRELWGKELVTGRAGPESIERAGIAPRPSRPVPVWLGGYADVALRRAARLADGFCVPGIAESESRLRLLQGYLREHGRDPTTFPTELIMTPPKGPDQGDWPRDRPSFISGTADTVARWKGLGGTHAAIATYWMGLESLSEHLAYAEKAINVARQ